MTPTEQIDTKELRKAIERAKANEWASIGISNDTLTALLDRLERAEAAAGAVPEGSITGDEVTKLAHALIREQLDGEDEDFHNSRAHGIGSLNADILNFIKSRAAAPSAPVAAQAEPVKRILLPEALCKQLLRDYFQRTKNGSERQTPVLRELLHATYAHGRAMAATPPAPMQEAGDALLVELRDWFEAQRKAISKGCGSAWDMAQCAEQIEKINRAIATSKEEA